MRIEKKLETALAGDMTPKFLATLDAEGVPNCVPVISITPWKDDLLLFAEFLMNKTRKNLQVDTHVAVTVINQAFETWEISGEFLGFQETGDQVDFVNNLPMLRYNAYTSARAAGCIKINSISPMRKIPQSRFLLAYLYSRLNALLYHPAQNTKRAMPLRVEEKFGRMQAIRAIAWRDEQGSLHSACMPACVAAGSNHLLLHLGEMQPRFAALPEETEMAIAIITMDPIAYQVKGSFRGIRHGLGLIELTRCYSASPPLSGELLTQEGGID